jgi:peptidylprolyl isomerase
VSSRAKAAAIEAARRRKNRKRLGAALGLGVLVIAIVGAAAFTGGGGTSSSTTTTVDPALASKSTTTTAALPSAAGKPCVAVADPLPTGAPDVPVQVGPPPTDLVKEDLKSGDGAEVTAANTLSVNYIGVSCSTGKIFDSSYSRGQPASFPLANVIVGWQQGLTGMKVGGQRLLGIPPALAYGPQGRPGIAPDETLWFVVDVLSAS